MMTGMLATTLVLFAMAALAQSSRKADLEKWAIHDQTRPMPPVVDPGPAGPPAPVPSDAIVLFDGKDLSGWTNEKGAPAAWQVATATWKSSRAPARSGRAGVSATASCTSSGPRRRPAVGSDQDRGNSGVFLMDTYEVQVLDSYDSKTYADGMAAAIYGQYPPLVNASRKPGEWQTYDIVFHAPRFDEKGAVVRPARSRCFTTASWCRTTRS